MTDAEAFTASPPASVTGVPPELARIAASGGSECVYQHACDDGSTLLVRVRDGEAPVFEAVPPPAVEA